MWNKSSTINNSKKGWRFPTSSESEADENVAPDPLHDGFTFLRQIYFKTDPRYSARFSVPVLYDKVQRVIVNNESSEILRMLGTEVSLIHCAMCYICME